MTEDSTVSKNKNILALAGTTNNITESTNTDDSDATYFRVNDLLLFLLPTHYLAHLGVRSYCAV